MINWRAPSVLLLTAAVSITVSACSRREAERAAPAPPANQRIAPVRPAAAGSIYEGVTPMAARVAVLGLLNKRNGLVRDVTLRPGESIRLGRAVIRLRACERTAQWESPHETGAFVQLLILEHGTSRWRRAFSGWLFQNRPERNIVQHPIYDVFVKSCTMAWPGELPQAELDALGGPGARAAAGEPSARSSAQSSAPSSAQSNVPQRRAAPVAASPGPAPEPEPAPEPIAPAPATTAE